MERKTFKDFLELINSPYTEEEINREIRMTRLCYFVAEYLKEQGQLCDDTDEETGLCDNEDCKYCNMARALYEFESNEK